MQPEREIEEIWRNFRVSQEFDENPLKKLYSMGGAYFGNPGSNSSGMERGIANASAGVMSGATIYGSSATSSSLGMSGPGSAAYSIAPYFMKGSSSSTYRGASGLGSSYTTASAQYSGGKGGGGKGGGSAGGGK